MASASIAALRPPDLPDQVITSAAGAYSGWRPALVEGGGADSADDLAAEAGPAGDGPLPDGLVGALGQNHGFEGCRCHTRSAEQSTAQRYRGRPAGCGVGRLPQGARCVAGK